MPSASESEFWEQNYQAGNTRWNIGGAAPPFLSLLNSPAAPLPGRAAVLGCGRGYEAILFAKHSFEVIGFDFAPSAIAFATSLATTANLPAKFLERDIFDLGKEFPQYFDYIIEHTCFCAILPAQRPAYVQLVRSLLKPSGELIGLFFTHNRPGGPPFGSTPEEIRQHFSPDWQILSLEPVTNSIPQRQGEEHLGRFRLQ